MEIQITLDGGRLSIPIGRIKKYLATPKVDADAGVSMKTVKGENNVNNLNEMMEEEGELEIVSDEQKGSKSKKEKIGFRERKVNIS